MATTEQLLDALSSMREATRTLEAAKNALIEHDNSSDSHWEIRQELNKLKNSDVLWTNDEIESKMNTILALHTDINFRNAHAGVPEFMAQQENLYNNLAVRVQSLEKWRDTGINDDAKTDLQKRLAEVEMKYNIILDSLQSALIEAEANGSASLATEIRGNISKTLDEKKTALLAVIDDWHKEHLGNGSPTPTTPTPSPEEPAEPEQEE